MIYTFAVTKDSKLLSDVPLSRLFEKDIDWYWVDFQSPTEEEADLLSDQLKFHYLAVEDCLNFLQRPKIDYYGDYNFFVVLVLNQKTLAPEELDIFLSNKFIVSFHKDPSREVEEVRVLAINENKVKTEGPSYIFYKMLDKIVDNYFPAIYQIEDRLDRISDVTKNNYVFGSIKEVFDIRRDLFKLRRITNSMRDLLYRILDSDQLAFKAQALYFTDIYDHLIKISEMVSSAQDTTADLRDSYISINSNRMNTIITVLTVITSIFAPLTFIAGIYGMNFTNMPELYWRYGYFAALGVMFLIGIGMYLWFRYKGWLDFFR